jgi:NitT/TauT family transport system ATP-binding protein
MLVVENVRFRYLRQAGYALNGISLCCETEGVTTIVGRSGVGKSTLIALIAGIYRRTDALVGDFEGHITIDDQPPTTLSGPSVVSWVPQEPILLEHLSVMDNVLLPLTIDGKSQACAEAALSLLEDLGIGSYADNRPRNLSGGMRTRVSLARALVSEPKYLFLDEPFASLDLMNRWNIYRILKRRRSKTGLSTIMTTHDIPESIVLSDRIVVFSNDSTGVQVEPVARAGIDPNLEDPVECLRAARNSAMPIEAELLKNVPDAYQTRMLIK